MQDSLRTYLGLAMGLTETSRKKVRKTVKDAVGRGNATAEQVRTMTSDLLAANSSNREALVKLVKFEVDRALGMVGLATAEEVAELTGRIRALEAQLRAVEVNGPAPAATRRAAAAKRGPERAASATLPEAPAKRTRTPAKPSPGTKAAATTTAKQKPAKSTTARTSRSKATPAKATTARKTTTAGKATAKAQS
jgi:polyhydroxyalkanoate synthesis regulator phasin